MSEFTARANITNFKTQLSKSSNEVQKATLRELLAEERKELSSLPATDAELFDELGDSTYIRGHNARA